MRAYERLIKYAKVSTASEEGIGVSPSTPRQFDLARLLVDELRELGVADAEVTDTCYVYGHLPATPGHEGAPCLGFIAHMDTSPDFSGKDVRPRVIEQYDGGDIVLNEALGIVTSVSDFPALQKRAGKTLIVTDGTTLLGADDKAGIAEILQMAEEILRDDLPHGTVKIGFTPDEEIGEGADHFDVEGFGCDYAYTVDGGQLGGLDYETFNAASAVVEVEGVSTHTGGAKGKMVNSMSVAMEFCALLPKGQVPELTEGREGFIHLDAIHGNVEHTVMQFLIRDHDKELFRQKKELMEKAAAYINAKYPTQPLALTLKDSYYNMREMIEPRMEILENMERAMKENGVEPHSEPVRGGTDGARLSFMGLPCPNICTGGANAHGKTEYVVLEDMEKIKDIIKTAIYNVE